MNLNNILKPRNDIDLKDIRGMFETVTTTPTVFASTLYEQLKIVNPGATIDTGWKFPSATGFNVQGNAHNQWTNASNAYADDGSYATIADTTGNLRQSYGDFGFGVPVGATIIGVAIETQGKMSAGTASVTYRVGADRSAGDYSAVAQTWSTTETVFSDGGATTLWGAIATGADVADGGFYFSIFPSGSGSGNTCSLDYVKAKVYYRVPNLTVYNYKADTWLSVTMT